MKIVAMTVCTVDGYPDQGIECVGGNSLNFATQCQRSGVEHVSLGLVQKQPRTFTTKSR